MDNTKVLLDTEASIPKEYFWGLDIGSEKDTGVTAIGHRDENGKLVIDRIIQGVKFTCVAQTQSSGL